MFMTSAQVGLVAPAATIVAALIGLYAVLRSRRGTTPTSAEKPKKPYVVATAHYQWLEDSIMWALREHLSAEAEKVIEQTDVFDSTGHTSIESILARHDGVKFNTFVYASGFQPQFSPIQLVVQGNHSAPTIIRSIRAHVVTRQPPLSGTLIYGPPQGEESVIDIVFDLDSSDAIALKVDGFGMPAEPYFSKSYLTLEAGESMTFAIRAQTGLRYCEWQIELNAIVAGKDRKVVVRDPEGRPFRTTALAGSYETVYSLDFTSGKFVRMPPDFQPSVEG